MWAWGPLKSRGILAVLGTSLCSLSFSHPPTLRILLKSSGFQKVLLSIVMCGPVFPVPHRLSFPAAGGISLDQGSNPCPWHSGRILHHWNTREVHKVPSYVELKPTSLNHIPTGFWLSSGTAWNKLPILQDEPAGHLNGAPYHPPYHASSPACPPDPGLHLVPLSRVGQCSE